MPILTASSGTSIISGVADVISVAGQAVTFLTNNPLCLLYIGASVLLVGFGIFKAAKRSSK